MKRLIIIVDQIWQDNGTTFLRRVFLALLCGSGLWFLIMRAKHSQNPVPLNQCIYMSIGAGAVAMLVTGMLEVSRMLWAKGIIGKLVAALFVFFSVSGIIALIGIAITSTSGR